MPNPSPPPEPPPAIPTQPAALPRPSGGSFSLAKWTPERTAQYRHVVEAARAFVRCADEFSPVSGEWFFPEATAERFQHLVEALDREAKLWDAGAKGPDESEVAP